MTKLISIGPTQLFNSFIRLFTPDGSPSRIIGTGYAPEPLISLQSQHVDMYVSEAKWSGLSNEPADRRKWQSADHARPHPPG